MSSRITTGEGTTYTDADTAGLRRAMSIPDGAPTGFSATGVVEWAGTLNQRPERTLNADGLKLGPVTDALREAQAVAGQTSSAHRASTYTAKTWRGQLSGLRRTGVGSSALADLPVSTRTQQAWATGKRKPSKANQARIAAAYNAVATRHQTAAQQRQATADRRVADRLSNALGQRYGVDVRITNVKNWTWR